MVKTNRYTKPDHLCDASDCEEELEYYCATTIQHYLCEKHMKQFVSYHIKQIKPLDRMTIIRRNR